MSKKYRMQLAEEERRVIYQIERLEQRIEADKRRGDITSFTECRENDLKGMRKQLARVRTELRMYAEADQRAFAERVKHLEDMLPEKPARPPDPVKGEPETLDPWFVYYHQMKAAGFKYTLVDLAQEVGYSPGYVKQLHARWKTSNQI